MGLSSGEWELLLLISQDAEWREPTQVSSDLRPFSPLGKDGPHPCHCLLHSLACVLVSLPSFWFTAWGTQVDIVLESSPNPINQGKLHKMEADLISRLHTGFSLIGNKK
jgi:hypothetical protein